MKSLIKYDLRKNLRIAIFVSIANIMAALLFNIISSFSYDMTAIDHSEIFEDSLGIFSLSLFAYLYLVIFAYFIYLAKDFSSNLYHNEKYLLFTHPSNSYKYLLTKIITATITTAPVYVSYFFSVMLLANDTPITAPKLIELTNDFFKALPYFYSLSLSALMLAYFSIIVTKKLNENLKFEYFWIIPFVLSFSLLLIINGFFVNDLSFNNYLFIPLGLKSIIIFFLISITFFLINAFILEKHFDF